MLVLFSVVVALLSYLDMRKPKNYPPGSKISIFINVTKILKCFYNKNTLKRRDRAQAIEMLCQILKF